MATPFPCQLMDVYAAGARSFPCRESATRVPAHAHGSHPTARAHALGAVPNATLSHGSLQYRASYSPPFDPDLWISRSGLSP